MAINVCQNIKQETFGLKDGIDAAEMGGFVRRDHGDFSIGCVINNFALRIFVCTNCFSHMV